MINVHYREVWNKLIAPRRQGAGWLSLQMFVIMIESYGYDPAMIILHSLGSAYLIVRTCFSIICDVIVRCFVACTFAFPFLQGKPRPNNLIVVQYIL